MSKRKSVFEDNSLFETLSYGDIHEKEQKLVYAISRYDEKTGRRINEVILLDLVSKEKRIITAGGLGEDNPQFAPDGKQLLFLSVVPGMGRQLFLADLTSGEVKQLTQMRYGLMEPMWSPDGKKILFASVGDADRPEEFYRTGTDKEETARYEKEKAKAPIVITDFGYKFDGAGFVKPEHVHLWIVNAESGEIRRITDGPFDYLHPVWAPDGKKVLCVSSRFRPRKDSIAADLITIDVSGNCNMIRLTDKAWAVSYPNPVRPVFTPDGKYIIMGFLEDNGSIEETSSTGYPPAFLHRIAVDGGEDVCLMKESDICYDGVQFPYNAFCGRGLDKVRISSDGKYAYFLSGWKGQAKLFKVNIYGDTYQVEPVLGGKMAIGGIGLPQNGNMVISKSEPDLPEGYYLFHELTGKMELLVQSNESLLDQIDYSKPEDFWFQTLDGESQVHGWAMPPQNAVPGERYPCILYIHGGPHPFYTYGFTHEFQCFAGAGYGIIYCNPRGSSGYGSVHRNLERAMDGSAYMDCLQFTDEACRRFSWIDPDRIGVTGGSYGGYMTNYIATHSSRFKAYITQRSVSNNLISYASSDTQGESKAYPNFEEFMAAELKTSVVSYAERIQAPFLILHGMEDLRTPVEGAHQLFVAVKDLHPDLPVKMVLYPHTGHDQPRHPKQALHYYQEMLSWFDNYLK